MSERFPISQDEATRAQVSAILMQRELENCARVVDRLRAEGWIICEPSHVPMPRSHAEAAAMLLLAENYLKADALRRADG